MKTEKNKGSEFHKYTPVEELEIGTTLVNLGVIKAVYPHKNGSEYQLHLEPTRDFKARSYWYKKGDKLMIA